MSSEMDLINYIQKLPGEDHNLDEDQTDTLKMATCLLAAAAVHRVKAKARKRRIRGARKRKSVWVREWLLNRPRYGMYVKLMKHLSEGDAKSFKNFVRLDPNMFNQMVEDLTPKLQKKTINWRKPLSPGLKLTITLRYLASG